MIEVFRTNVEDHHQAMMIVDQLHKNFPGFKANFDLQDCDNILRVQSAATFIEAEYVISFLKDFGFDAEILPDDTGPQMQFYMPQKRVTS